MPAAMDFHIRPATSMAGDPANGFIWGLVERATRKVWICAGVATESDGRAQADIWLAEWERSGDADAAFQRVCTARGVPSGTKTNIWLAESQIATDADAPFARVCAARSIA